MPDGIEYLKNHWNDLSSSFGKAITTIQGWAGILVTVYFSPGTIWTTILGLQVVDLFTGTILALKITRWVNKHVINNFPIDEEDFPEFIAVIRSGKKKPFNWTAWALWLEKLAVTFILVIGCELFKFWLIKDKPWIIPGVEIIVGIVYFVLVSTNLRSTIRNTALITKSSALLLLWKVWGAYEDYKIREMLIDRHLVAPDLLKEKDFQNIKKEKKSDGIPELS